MSLPTRAELAHLAAEQEIVLLRVMETGPRARGMPSPDSPVELRFLYARPPARYLRVFEIPDTLTLTGADGESVVGWDIRKAVGQLRKGHHQLREWLSSTRIIHAHPQASPMLDRWAERAFLPRPMQHHYLSGARQEVRKLVIGGDIRLRTLLDTLRVLLSCRWVAEHGVAAPLDMRELLQAYLPGGDIREIVDELLDLKASSPDLEIVPPQEELGEYLLRLFGQLENMPVDTREPITPADCDTAFHQLLTAVWPSLHLPADPPAHPE